MTAEDRPSPTTDEDVAAFHQSLAAMAESMEAMLAASVRMQILLLEQARDLLEAPDEGIDSVRSGPDNGSNC